MVQLDFQKAQKAVSQLQDKHLLLLLSKTIAAESAYQSFDHFKNSWYRIYSLVNLYRNLESESRVNPHLDALLTGIHHLSQTRLEMICFYLGLPYKLLTFSNKMDQPVLEDLSVLGPIRQIIELELDIQRSIFAANRAIGDHILVKAVLELHKSKTKLDLWQQMQQSPSQSNTRAVLVKIVDRLHHKIGLYFHNNLIAEFSVLTKCDTLGIVYLSQEYFLNGFQCVQQEPVRGIELFQPVLGHPNPLDKMWIPNRLRDPLLSGVKPNLARYKLHVSQVEEEPDPNPMHHGLEPGQYSMVYDHIKDKTLTCFRLDYYHVLQVF
ncbi:hypothetical protein EDD86DRAFT_244754 [Gorgonomyces haynaldii]|nr:hypothetical protein EDD86DRAFT_244754 [Gorgonomyces haynaldii]